MCLLWEGNTARIGTKSCCSGSAGAVHAQHMYFGLPWILFPDTEAMLLDIDLLLLVGPTEVIGHTVLLVRFHSAKFAV